MSRLRVVGMSDSVKSVRFKTCPLTKDPCLGEQCMWWIKGREKCAIVVIAEKL